MDGLVLAWFREVETWVDLSRPFPCTFHYTISAYEWDRVPIYSKLSSSNFEQYNNTLNLFLFPSWSCEGRIHTFLRDCTHTYLLIFLYWYSSPFQKVFGIERRERRERGAEKKGEEKRKRSNAHLDSVVLLLRYCWVPTIDALKLIFIFIVVTFVVLRLWGWDSKELCWGLRGETENSCRPAPREKFSFTWWLFSIRLYWYL